MALYSPVGGDYFQAVKGGGHGDYHFLVLAPNSVQEMVGFVGLGFDLAFKYHQSVMMLSDGVIGQMMEKVFARAGRSASQMTRSVPSTLGLTIGHDGDWEAIVTSLELQSQVMEENNHPSVSTVRWRVREVPSEELQTEDAEYIIVAFGSSSHRTLNW